MDVLSLCGWVDDQQAVEEVLAQMPQPVFESAPGVKDLISEDDNKDVFMWEAEKKVLNRILPSQFQKIGCCVSKGWGRGCQDLMLIQILGGALEEWKAEIATEPIYGGSRVQVGNGKLGSGDGSVGAWASKWVTDWGLLLRLVYGQYDLTENDNDVLAKKMGVQGVPQELQTIAKLHPVGISSLITDADAGWSALGNKNPIPICSNQGFTMERDNTGRCTPKGSWGHCMLTRGRYTHKGGSKRVLIQNSWGDYLKGNNHIQCESGQEVELPQGVFACDMEVWSKILKQRDSFAISRFKAFIKETVDWTTI